MSLFEFTFGLTAVFLGLALARIVDSLQKLVHAGRRVRWAPEPLMLATIVFTVIIAVWLNQWKLRDQTQTAFLTVILTAIEMMAIYFAAAAVLPQVEAADHTIDLRDHYYETRTATYGALIAGLLTLIPLVMTLYPEELWTARRLFFTALFPGLYLALILVRWRPFHLVVLPAGLIYWAWSQIGRTLGG